MNNQYKLGALKSPKDLRNYRIAKTSFMVDLPAVFILPHSNIKDQQDVSSCVAHSLSEILEAKSNINHSTEWIYGYRPSGYYQGPGMYTSEAIKTLNKVGSLTYDELPGNYEMPKAKEIVDKDLDKYTIMANPRKIKAYAELKSIREIKQALYLYKTPVVVCILVDENGLELDNNYIAQIPQKPYGGHATVCYGWNETGLLIQNSWGTEWGNEGTFILPETYDFYEAWMVIPEDNVAPSNEQDIIKPKAYIIRKLIMSIVKILRKLFKK